MISSFFLVLVKPPNISTVSGADRRGEADGGESGLNQECGMRDAIQQKNRAVFSWVLVRSPEEVPDECGFGSTRRVSLRWRDGGRPRRVARTVAPETQRPKNRKTSPVLGIWGLFFVVYESK